MPRHGFLIGLRSPMEQAGPRVAPFRLLPMFAYGHAFHETAIRAPIIACGNGDRSATELPVSQREKIIKFAPHASCHLKAGGYYACRHWKFTFFHLAGVIPTAKRRVGASSNPPQNFWIRSIPYGTS